MSLGEISSRRPSGVQPLTKTYVAVRLLRLPDDAWGRASVNGNNPDLVAVLAINRGDVIGDLAAIRREHRVAFDVRACSGVLVEHAPGPGAHVEEHQVRSGDTICGGIEFAEHRPARVRRDADDVTPEWTRLSDRSVSCDGRFQGREAGSRGFDDLPLVSEVANELAVDGARLWITQFLVGLRHAQKRLRREVARDALPARNRAVVLDRTLQVPIHRLFLQRRLELPVGLCRALR